jgi:hypothetical protein
MLSLACVKREETSTLRWFAAGALLAGAILVRVDAVLIAPALYATRALTGGDGT